MIREMIFSISEVFDDPAKIFERKELLEHLLLDRVLQEERLQEKRRKRAIVGRHLKSYLDSGECPICGRKRIIDLQIKNKLYKCRSCRTYYIKSGAYTRIKLREKINTKLPILIEPNELLLGPPGKSYIQAILFY